jgi:REP element-mobilizing transposase RayT
MPQSFASLHVHLVFSTKHRERTLEPEIRPRLHEIIGGILREHSSSLIAAGGTDDHIHLLVSLGRTISLADAVRFVKSNSSHWIHLEFPNLRDFQWQAGYGAFAVSYSNIVAVKAYIANQEAHHLTRSFQDELRELLTRHDIEWDEQYIWD